MTDRRRNIFILVFIAGLVIASLVVVATKPTKLGLDLKGGTSLVYQAKPTKQSQVTGEAVTRTIDIMRERVDRFGVAEPEIQRTGADQIDVSLPGVDNADQAREQVGKTAQLYFYDWETNVLDENCKPDPTNQAVTGGPAAGNGTGARSQYDAVRLASTCKPTDTGKETTTGQYYLVNTKTEKVLAGPAETRKDLEAEVEANKIKEGPNTEVLKVPQGTIVLGAEAPDGEEPDALLRDARPARAERPGHQEPGAELRQRSRRLGRAERHVRVHRQGQGGVAGDDARDRPARPGELLRGQREQRLPALRDRARRRDHLGAVHRLPAEPGRHRRRRTARRSRAASRSSPRRTSRTCSRPARCRSGSS